MAIDTSGSIGGRQLSAFLTEVKEVVDTVKPTGIRFFTGTQKYVVTSTMTPKQQETLLSQPSQKVVAVLVSSVFRSICKRRTSTRKHVSS